MVGYKDFYIHFVQFLVLLVTIKTLNVFGLFLVFFSCIFQPNYNNFCNNKFTIYKFNRQVSS